MPREPHHPLTFVCRAGFAAAALVLTVGCSSVRGSAVATGPRVAAYSGPVAIYAANAVPPNARFCAQCGAPQRKACASCGTDVSVRAKFCPQCGSAQAGTGPT